MWALVGGTYSTPDSTAFPQTGYASSGDSPVSLRLLSAPGWWAPGHHRAAGGWKRPVSDQRLNLGHPWVCEVSVSSSPCCWQCANTYATPRLGRRAACALADAARKAAAQSGNIAMVICGGDAEGQGRRMTDEAIKHQSEPAIEGRSYRGHEVVPHEVSRRRAWRLTANGRATLTSPLFGQRIP